MAARATLNAKRARELFNDGLGCNAIARELDVDPATVSRWAKREGLLFDRSQVDAANKAHTIDLAAMRIRLAEKMGATAENMLDDLDGPYLVYNFGGKDNTYAEHVLETPPVEVRRNAVATAGIAFDKITRIVERDPDTSGATSVLTAIETGLRAVVAELDAGVTTDEGA